MWSYSCEEQRSYVAYSRFPLKRLSESALRLHSPIPDASEKIASLRVRHSQLTSSIARFEARTSKQAGQLARMNRSKSLSEGFQITVEDFRNEEEEIRELEKKKRALEDRVSGMERDLGGLLR